MHALTSLLFALTAAAAALPTPSIPNYPTPNNPYGAFLVSLQYNPASGSESLSASYYHTGFDVNRENPLRNACVYAPADDPPYEKRCDHVEFTYAFDAGSDDITLQLNLAGETPMTVFGEGTMEWDETREDGTKLGSTVVQVVKAIA